MDYTKLWNYMNQEHGLSLLDSDIQEIIRYVEEMREGVQPFTGDMWRFLLVNAIRGLTEEQRAGLCFDLYCRSSIKDVIDKKIEEFRES